MIIPRLGKWSSSSGAFFIWERLYKFGWKWTPFCRVRLRYYKTLSDRNHSDQHINL